jgi:hypothetical protein
LALLGPRGFCVARGLARFMSERPKELNAGKDVYLKEAKRSAA